MADVVAPIAANTEGKSYCPKKSHPQCTGAKLISLKTLKENGGACGLCADRTLCKVKNHMVMTSKMKTKTICKECHKVKHAAKLLNKIETTINTDSTENKIIMPHDQPPTYTDILTQSDTSNTETNNVVNIEPKGIIDDNTLFDVIMGNTPTPSETSNTTPNTQQPFTEPIKFRIMFMNTTHKVEFINDESYDNTFMFRFIPKTANTTEVTN